MSPVKVAIITRIAALFLLAEVILGGDYHGRAHDPVPEHLWNFNHKPTVVLERHQLPRHFDW